MKKTSQTGVFLMLDKADPERAVRNGAVTVGSLTGPILEA